MIEIAATEQHQRDQFLACFAAQPV
jgi:hypothetical protein